MFNDYAKNISRNIYKSKKEAGLKILTTKQMLQRLSIALAQIKAGNNSESLLNEIRQIVHSLYQSKETTKKGYNKAHKAHTANTITRKFKISAPTWSDEFELPDGSYSISDIQDYFEYILKKHSENVDNLSIRIYVKKIEN